MFIYLTLLIRIMFGPFTYNGLVVHHYAFRVSSVSLLTMLTFNRVLKTLFILDFQRMSAVPEQKVMICMGLVTSICTLAHLVEEAVTRRILGLDHFSREYWSIYLGKVGTYLSCTA